MSSCSVWPLAWKAPRTTNSSTRNAARQYLKKFCNCMNGPFACLTTDHRPPDHRPEIRSQKSEVNFRVLSTPLFFSLCSWARQTHRSACSTTGHRPPTPVSQFHLTCYLLFALNSLLSGSPLRAPSSLLSFSRLALGFLRFAGDQPVALRTPCSALPAILDSYSIAATASISISAFGIMRPETKTVAPPTRTPSMSSFFFTPMPRYSFIADATTKVSTLTRSLKVAPAASRANFNDLV